MVKGILAPLLQEGKTKKIWTARWKGEILIENKDIITANDGRRQATFIHKAALVTRTTSNCFKLLHRFGLPTHFLNQENDVIFRAEKLTMIPIEIVIRRIAFGSYLKRNPNVKSGTQFEDLVVEFFYKSNFLCDPLLVLDQKENKVRRYDSHCILSEGLIDECSPRILKTLAIERWDDLKIIGKQVFEILETTWKKQGVTLVDMKIECGFTSDGRLIIGDVIDNDSWRLWYKNDVNKAMDKQLYKDGRPIDFVARQYRWVTNATDLF